jgi:hypothetical protein
LTKSFESRGRGGEGGGHLKLKNQFIFFTKSNNQFTTSYAYEFIKIVNSELQPDIDIFNTTQLEQMNLTEKVDTLTTIYNGAISKMLSKNLTDNERRQLGHSLDDILYKCSFNNQPCAPEDFIWKFDRFI